MPFLIIEQGREGSIIFFLLFHLPLMLRPSFPSIFLLLFIFLHISVLLFSVFWNKAMVGKPINNMFSMLSSYSIAYLILNFLYLSLTSIALVIAFTLFSALKVGKLRNINFCTFWHIFYPVVTFLRLPSQLFSMFMRAFF